VYVRHYQHVPHVFWLVCKLHLDSVEAVTAKMPQDIEKQKAAETKKHVSTKKTIKKTCKKRKKKRVYSKKMEKELMANCTEEEAKKETGKEVINTCDGEKVKEKDEEEEEVKMCKFCAQTDKDPEQIDICDVCNKYFCLQCLDLRRIRCECEENDASYHQFCSMVCADKFCFRFTFPCDGGCIALLSRHKQTSRYWGHYLKGPLF
jgi:hypothetical protein